MTGGIVIGPWRALLPWDVATDFVMTTVIYTINRVMETIFSLLIWPFRMLPPIWGLVFVSLLAGLFMVWVYGRVSNQAAIEQVRNRIRGNLLGVRLYQHDVPVVLRLQVSILRDTLTYMNHSLFPMLVLLIPILFLLVQLNYSFGFRPLLPREAALVKATFADPSLLGDVHLEVPSGVEVETPAVRIPSLGEATWRIRLKEPGRYAMKLHVGGQTVEKDVQGGTGWGPVSPLRSSSFTDVLLYHGEAPLPESIRVSSIEVVYPPLPLKVFGWQVHWLVFFFVASVLAAFACKGPMGVKL